MVRDYLESLGFLTRQPRKYQVIARGKNPDEEADWLAWNPGWKPGTERPAPGIWGARELGRVKALSVAVKGWHTDRFTPAMVSGTPELWRFAGGEAMAAASGALGVDRPRGGGNRAVPHDVVRFARPGGREAELREVGRLADAADSEGLRDDAAAVDGAVGGERAGAAAGGE